MSSETDYLAEADAIRQIGMALDPLTDEARDRVLAWADDIYGSGQSSKRHETYKQIVSDRSDLVSKIADDFTRYLNAVGESAAAVRVSPHQFTSAMAAVYEAAQKQEGSTDERV